MMKSSAAFRTLTLLILTTFSINGVAAAGPSVEESCWKTASEQGLLMRGAPEAANPGARQWNLVKIAYYNQSHPQDTCADQIFSKATDDAQKYWNYIGNKYHCDTQGGAHSGACSSYQLSTRHIKTMQTIYTDVESGKPYPRRGHDSRCKDELQEGGAHKVLTQGAKDSIKGASAVASAVAQEGTQEDSCAAIPDEERRKPDESHVLLSAKFWLDTRSCNNEIAKSFAYSSLDTYTLGAVDLAPETELDSSAYAVSLTQFATHPVESTGKLVEGFMQSILPAYECYNNQLQSAAICRTLGNLEGLLFGGGALAKSVTWVGKKLLAWSLKFGGTYLLDAIAAKFPQSAGAIAKLKTFATPKAAQAENEVAQTSKASASTPASQSLTERMNQANDRIKEIQERIKAIAKQAEAQARENAQKAGKSASDIKAAGDDAFGTARLKARKDLGKELKAAEKEYKSIDNEIEALKAAMAKAAEGGK